ncbi:metal ABC transporter permease [Paramaledivibacter caminithermalis]|jgi:zinc transport system permease protein|uniref:Zinc transport system permease protein n=1 Tax=Paramaledivibacter caminithermalis (strain DSM 15212 / CIP 107654 / DViRD3) TaxID=1121301 RepID=A0A1M6PM79_PARC5|nr:metal ABC transporter permease [Paramaledivibacter caminithermalis]SHK09038.1 zinc transport system permease protein [Paramaledivibacter caminithermalis DSM 15212]
MIKTLFGYTFMQNAFMAAILASIVCGVIGTIITQKRLVSMSGGIAHASFGGIGLGYLLDIEPIIGGLIFSVLASLGISIIKRKTNTYSDTLIGMFWSFGMALGILFISLTPGYPPDMTSYLFGDILTVSSLYIKMMAILSFIIIFFIACIFNYWRAYLFDEEFTKTLGVNTLALEYTLFILISLSIVILTKVVGIILVIALLTIPTAIAKLFTYNLKNMMTLSSIIGAIFSISGLLISYQYNIPSGATIILLSVIGFFLISLIYKKISRNQFKQ